MPVFNPARLRLERLQAQRFRLPLRTLLIVLLVIFFTLGMRQFGWFEPLELYAYDWRMRLRPPLGPDPRLLVVGITEEDIQKFQYFPLPDAIYTEILQTILAHQPAVVGLDVYRDFPQGKGTEAFSRILQQTSNLIVIQRLSADASKTSVPPPPGVPPQRVGFNDLAVDRDGVIRRNLIYVGHQGKIYASFSWLVALEYLKQYHLAPGIENNNPYHIRLGEAVLKPLQKNSGNYQNVDAEGYQTLLNYRPTLEIARRISFSEVLQGNLKPEWVRDKIVLIGTVAESARDVFVTPYSRERAKGFYMPGVEIHAAKVSELISVATGNAATAGAPSQKLFDFWTESGEIAWIIGWSLLGGLLAWLLRHPLKLPLALLISLILLFVLHWHLFNQMLWIPLAAPLLGLLSVSASVLMTRYVYYAFYDELTGLPNRNLFIQRLRQLHRSHRRFAKIQTRTAIALILLDLERFKVINAVLGHDAGDALLVAFTQRVQAVLENARDILPSSHALLLARVGGTEFGFFFKTLVEDNQSPTLLAQHIRSKMHQPFYLHNEEVFTHANIGIAIGYVGDQRDLLRDARAAMNRAKLLEKDAPEIFALDMEEKAIQHFKLERDLRRATHYYRPENRQPEHWLLPDIQEFFLCYQPLVDLSSGRIAGFEALVRWQHPQRGLVSPGEFIPVAEETGLILPMGEWILYQACRQMHHWQTAFPHYPELLISVNLSRRQFIQPFLTETIQAVLSASGLSSAWLKLEITESAVMDDIQNTLAMLKRLKSIGVQLSIDDFGTGYSSLEYLTQFPTDTLKIDQSFVRNLEHSEKNQIVVESIVELAHRLGMNIVCEGIEEERQLQLLRKLGCEYGQGYWFSRPVLKEQAEQLLVENPRW